MASNTTIFTHPDLLSPVTDLQGNSYQLNNTSFGLNNFKYTTQLYAKQLNSAGYPMIVQENVPPRPSTGLGLYSGYQPLLSLLNYDLNNGIVSATQAFNSLLIYNIRYGLEWNPGLTISSVFIYTVLGVNFYGLSCSSATGLSASDTIFIQSQNSGINGSHVIGVILTPNSFVLSLIAGSASAGIQTGTITNAQRWNGYSDYYYAYNGTRQYNEVGVDFSYLVMPYAYGVSVNTPFLTTYPTDDKKLIMSNQNETLSFFINYLNFATASKTFYVKYDFYDSSDNLIAVKIVACPMTNELTSIQRWDIPVGTTYLSPTASTSYYNVFIAQYIPGPAPHYLEISELRTYLIDTSCSIYNNVRLMWLNSYGAFDYFNFRLDDHKSYRINRNEYKQILPLDYNIGQRQRTILSQQVTEQHIVNTNWITEDQLTFVNNILTSPEVYVIDEATNDPYPLIITDNNVDYKTAYRDQLFNLTLTYETSYDIETQKQ